MNFGKLLAVFNQAVEPLIPNFFVKEQFSSSSPSSISSNDDAKENNSQQSEVKIFTNEHHTNRFQHDTDEVDDEKEILKSSPRPRDSVLSEEEKEQGCEQWQQEPLNDKPDAQYQNQPLRLNTFHHHHYHGKSGFKYVSSLRKSANTFLKQHGLAKSNGFSLKNPIRRKGTSPANPPMIVTANCIVSSPPSPEATVPLWSEQVDNDMKMSMDPMDILRQEVIFEIIRTEKEFVDDVKYSLEHYAAAIFNSSSRLPHNLARAFHVLQDIYYLHTNVSRQLLNVQAIYPVVPSITNVLNELANHFQVYDDFLLHHKAAIAEIAHARKKNNKLGQLIVVLEANAINGRYRSIESLLAKPVQRLCKYPLLVMTLIRATSPHEQDHMQLRALYHKMDCSIRELHQERHNRAKKELEDLSRKLSSGFGFVAAPFQRKSGASRISSRRNSQTFSIPRPADAK